MPLTVTGSGSGMALVMANLEQHGERFTVRAVPLYVIWENQMYLYENISSDFSIWENLERSGIYIDIYDVLLIYD